MRCKNGHVVSIESGLSAQYCPTCGLKVRISRPLEFGMRLGLVSSVVVSFVELAAFSYTSNLADRNLGWAMLLVSIPSVFVLTGGLGAVYLKRRYGNTRGISTIVFGATPWVIIFFFVWVIFIAFISAFPCPGTC